MNIKNTTICGIAAVGPDNVIGLDGKMPWHSSKDFYHFKHITYGSPCIFGKKTYENMATKPLPGRKNIVVSSAYNDELVSPNYYRAQNIESAIKQCKGYNYVFICGGSVVYKYFFDNDLIDIMYLTQVYDDNLAKQISQNPNAYVRFPKDINEFFDSKKWHSENIIYPDDYIKNKVGPKVDFYKFTRVR